MLRKGEESFALYICTFADMVGGSDSLCTMCVKMELVNRSHTESTCIDECFLLR